MADLVNRILEAWRTDPTMGRDRLAKMFGLPRGHLRRPIQQAKAAMSQQPQAAKPTEEREYRDNRMVVNVHGVPFNDPELLIDYLKLDRAIWRLDVFKFKAYQGFAAEKAQSKVMHRPDRKGGGTYIAWERPEKTKIITADLYSITATFVRKVAEIAARAEIDAMLAEIRTKAVRYAPIDRAPAPTGNMLELSLPDLHVGKLAWGQETGWGDYDSRIAEQTFRDAFAAILQRTSAYKFDRVCFVIGNDLLNADNSENTTTGGTPVSCDTRHTRSFQIARRLNTWAIEQARLIAPVDVVMIPGNHDSDTVFYLGEVLDATFANCPDVRVDNAPTSRKFYQWGKVGLMFTHKGGKGEREAQRNRLVMATENRRMWGDTRFNEIHTGDLHQVRLEEQFGVRVRVLPSLCSPDDWHAVNKFVGNIRSAEAYIWNRESGLLGMAYYNVIEDRAA